MLAPPVILLAEDDPNDVFLLRRAFQRLKCEERLVHCNNGEEVVSTLASSFSESQPVPTLCLLDVKMPRKNGFETLQWIRSHPAFCSMPVVMMSSSSQETDIELALALGATDYIVKPRTLDALYRIVQTLADRWRLCDGFNTEHGCVTRSRQ